MASFGLPAGCTQAVATAMDDDTSEWLTAYHHLRVQRGVWTNEERLRVNHRFFFFFRQTQTQSLMFQFFYPEW